MHFQPIEPSDEDAYLAPVGGGAVAMPPAAEETGAPALGDPLGDVFGSETASPAEHGGLELPGRPHSHPSDMHRLQTEHSTAGYREGITVSKESSMQAGFDEGFSLGATIGQQAGLLLGTLEGIFDAVKGQAQASEAAAAAGKRLADARLELSTARIFSPDYWSPDGNWTYQVEAADGQEVLFAHVASAHPLITKWSRIVDEQVESWAINPAILDHETSPRLAPTSEELPKFSTAPATNKPLDW